MDFPPVIRVLKSVSRPNQFGIPTTLWVVAALLIASLGLGDIRPVRALPVTAQRFFAYMHAIDQSGQDLGFWDKLTYSLILSGPNPHQSSTRPVARARL